MDRLDCFCKIGDRTFRYRAGAIIIEDGYLLLARDPRLPHLYSVGGGVHIDETAEEALVREVLEETGVRYEVDRLAYVSERFVGNEHRLGLYFLMKPRGTRELPERNGPEQTVWIPLRELDAYSISPNWFKTELLNLSEQVKYLTAD